MFTAKELRGVMVKMLSYPSICSVIDPHKFVGVQPIKKDDTIPFYANLVRKDRRFR